MKVEKYIVRFDIKVDQLLGVHILKSLRDQRRLNVTSANKTHLTDVPLLTVSTVPLAAARCMSLLFSCSL